MSKKICFVIDHFNTGGIERITANTAKALLNSSIDVDIISLTNKYGASKGWFDSRCNIKVLKWPKVLAIIPLWWHFLFNRYDVVLSGPDFANVYVFIANKLTFKKTKLIATTRNNLVAEFKYNHSTMRKLVFILARWLYPFTDINIAVSHGVADGMREQLKLKKNIAVIYNPAAKESSFSLTPISTHPWFEEKAPVILSCGRLEKQKDFQLLINSFSEVIKQIDAKLIIIGEGSLRKELEEQVKKLGLENKISLLGAVDEPETYMYHARLFVLSSLWEGFGNVIVEALSVGCPVVSMNCPSGPSEILEDGKWGKLVEERDLKKLADVIVSELKSTKPKRGTLQERAKDFTPEKIINKYLELIN